MSTINGIKITGLQEKPIGFDRVRELEGHKVFFNNSGETPFAYIQNHEGTYTKLTDERDIHDQLARIESLIRNTFNVEK